MSGRHDGRVAGVAQMEAEGGKGLTVKVDLSARA